jgi:hypothetical protein
VPTHGLKLGNVSGLANGVEGEHLTREPWSHRSDPTNEPAGYPLTLNIGMHGETNQMDMLGMHFELNSAYNPSIKDGD